MPVSLSNVFDSFGYNKPAEQIALTKLAAYRGCFDKEGYENTLISDAKASELLEISFDSLENGINWLCEITQKKWLRSTFRKEGMGADKDPVINMERWQEIAQSVAASEESVFSAIFNTLSLVEAVGWPLESAEHVVIHGALENFVSERVHFLKNFTGHLYYMSNPRGLFNNEPSLAPILAHWFEKADVTAKIQSVLDKNKDMRASDKNWLKNLEGLKQEILDAIGESIWPTGKGYYYKNPEPFEQAAQAEGRQSLAGWPTAIDMVEYLIIKRQLKEPELFTNINLIPVYSVRQGKVATTENNMEDFYKNYAQHLPENTRIIFVSNNSQGLHYIHFQDVIAKETLRRLNAQPLDIITVGPAADKISLSAATDVFAKIFYTKRPEVLKTLQESTRAELPVSETLHLRMFGLKPEVLPAEIKQQPVFKQ